VRAAPRPNPIERRTSKFLGEPPSVRTAASVIVVATAMIVAGSGVLIRVFDHSEYSSVWVGMWWALQTVTTVGYGDVTPTEPLGRLIAAFVMLEGIAFLAIVTASITSTFVARAQQSLGASGEAHLVELDRRLERIERALGIEPPPESPPSNDASPSEQLLTLRQGTRQGRRK
jgi:voltage-gated potassium channel